MKITKIAVCLLAAAMLVMQGTFASALLDRSQDDKVWSQYIDTKTDFEKNVHDLVMTKWPKYKDISKEHLKLELEKLDQKSAQFKYLKDKHPDRLVRNKGISDFASFDWSDKDQQALVGSNHSYAEREKDIAQMQRAYDRKSNKGDFEKRLDEVKDSVEYRSFEQKMKDMMAKLDASFQNLKRDLKN